MIRNYFSHIKVWRELASIMIILMEASWVTPWFRSLTPETYAASPLRVFIVLAGMVIFSNLLVRVMEYLRVKKSIRQGIMVVFAILGIFIGLKTLLFSQQAVSVIGLLNRPLQSFADVRTIIPVEFIVIIFVLLAFWRGLAIAQENIGPSFVMDHFWIGIVMYVIFVFLITIATGETPGDFFFIFLFSSLIAMISSRMAVIGKLRGGRESIFNRYWFFGMLAAAVFVVGIAYLVSYALGNHFSWITSIFVGFFSLLLILVWMILNPVLSLVDALLSKLAQDFNGFPAVGQTVDGLSNFLRNSSKLITDHFAASKLGAFLAQWAPIIKSVVLIIIILVALAALISWMAIKLWGDRERRYQGEEERINLRSENIFRLIRDLLSEGLTNAISSLQQLADFNHRQKLRAAARIRQVYADLMDLCASLGHPRREAETPLEFLPELNQLFPGLQPEIQAITEAYNGVRYGQLPESRREVETIEIAWNKIISVGREFSAEQKHMKKK